ncbi:MAG: structural protein P5 [Bacteroidaceae bacterium]|nr:structural protein P5 [Bacteroidaceae bacterium]
MRGLRNNNPLNIRHSADRWNGAAETQTDKEFVQFKSMVYGYRAAWRTLHTYYKRLSDRKKHFTVENIIGRWAPPTENDTKQYIRMVLSLSSIGGKENLLPPANPMGYTKLSRMLAAMTVMENGIRPHQVDMEAIYQGYKLAFPENAQELDESLLCEDEYGEW